MPWHSRAGVSEEEGLCRGAQERVESEGIGRVVAHAGEGTKSVVREARAVPVVRWREFE